MKNIIQILGLIINFDDNEIILELISPFMIDIIILAKLLNFIINIKTVGGVNIF